MKKLISAYKYQLANQMNATAWFYGVILIIYFSGWILSGKGWLPGFGTNAVEFSSIFLFVMGLCSFRENFHMLTQNNIQRGNLFKSRLMVVVTAAAVVALADILVSGIFSATGGGFIMPSVFRTEYVITDGAFFIPMEFLYKFAVNLLMTTSGYFITLMFYRLNAIGKVLVGAGIPLLMFAAFMFNEYLCITYDVFINYGAFMETLMGKDVFPYNPHIAVLTFTAVACFFTGATWLLIRKAPVKK